MRAHLLTQTGGTGCEIPAPLPNQPGIRVGVCTSLFSIGKQGKHTPIYKMHSFPWQSVPGRFCSSGHSPLEAVKPLCLPWPWLSQSSKEEMRNGKHQKGDFFFPPDIKILTLSAARNPSPGRPVGAAGPAVDSSSPHKQLETWGGDGWRGWSEKWEATAGWREATPL